MLPQAIPARSKLSETVAKGIWEMIHSSTIPSGEQIPTEAELMTLFNVSRTAIREGIKSLVAIGILETRHGVGTFVTGAQPGPFRNLSGVDWTQQMSLLFELLEFRRIVEPEMAALAAQRRTDYDLQVLSECVAALEKGVAKGECPPEDLGFHLALAQATRNSALVDISDLIRRFYQNDPDLPDASDVQAHRAILDAVRAQNPEQARQVMRQHFDELEIRYRRYEAAEQSPTP